MIGCPLAEALMWQGQRADAGAGRHGDRQCVRVRPAVFEPQSRVGTGQN